MYVLIVIGGLAPEEAPIPPDPNDRSLSKRQWELGTEQQLSIMEGHQDLIGFDNCLLNTLTPLHGMQAWRSAVKSYIQ